MSGPGALPVGGLVPLSTVDWPDRLAAVVFLRGCPWACGYCHNPDLRQAARPGQAGPGWDQLLKLLALRQGLLDGVVFSGGEPTAHAALGDALAEVRALGFGTALHTGGAYPEALAGLLARGLVDWVGFDVKGPFGDYARITGREDAGARARRSLESLVRSGVPFELRTTVDPRLLDEGCLQRMAGELRADGASTGGHPLVLQRCNAAQPGLPALPGLDLPALAARLASAFSGPVLARA
ncbi:MAG TPA: anaerobic ribonucleoside-triphosphate reductase activating protein [Myxococcota bacterium]|nr:anaerobic ribonucleoside-triphosphate reductase activating protein [Myxococcota bacterium]HRY93362.1 anaerobic ribonucleoside-triphosphate reductase activating protein [Myxococcota bacterium]